MADLLLDPLAASGAAPRDPRYPVELIDVWRLNDGRRVLVRPILPQDAPLFDAFVRGLAARSRYLRFHGPVAALPADALARLVRVDHREHLALVASVFDGGTETAIAEARYVLDRVEGVPGEVEFAVAVSDAWQGRGVGRRLLAALARAAADAGHERLVGDVLADNVAMLALARSAGARVRRAPGSGPLLRVVLDARAPRPGETGAAPSA